MEKTPIDQSEKDNAIFLAMSSGDTRLLDKVLGQGANPNACLGEDQRSPLSTAILLPPEHRIKVVKTLLAHGANPNFPRDLPVGASNSGHPSGHPDPFMRACMRGDESSAVAMMESRGPIKVDLLSPDMYGWIPSMAACSGSPDFLSKMQIFFERENISSRTDLTRGHLWTFPDKSGRNAAMNAHDHPTSLRWIFSQKYLDPDQLINAVDNEGESVLWIACKNLSGQSVRLLMGMGANVGVVNRHGVSLVDMLDQMQISLMEDQRARYESVKGDVTAAAASQAAAAAIGEVIRKHGLDKFCSGR